MTACPHCTTLNPLGNRYCFGCGQPLQRACSGCGERMPLEARFCGACGTPAERQQPLRQSSSEAELKHATVLFADIVSSTKLIAAMDAEESLQFLMPVVAAMAQTVIRHGGTIGRTLGDGLMGLFGAPLAHEGHAVLACRTALALHAVAAEHHGVRLRVGIHSGEVAIHTRADGIERDLLLHGLAIHLASRVVSMAEPGATYLTAQSMALAGPFYEATLVGSRHAPGFEEPVELYRLMGLPAVRPVARSARSDSPGLRGRRAELARMSEALADTGRGESRIVGVVGAPGAGKSRLCAEFAAHCRRQHVPVLEARAQLYGHATPLLPVLDFLRSALIQVAPGDDAATVRRRVSTLIQSIGGDAAQNEALLDEFLGVAESGGAAAGLGAKARRARIVALVSKMIRHLAKGPLVILIEDLHWMDTASAEFFAALIDAVAKTPTLLLVNYRPGCRTAWMDSATFSEIALRDLTEADIAGLIEELIGERPDTHDLALRIARRSGGNPFFAEEMVRALQENGTLAADRSLPRAKAQEAPLPATVQAVIGGRIDQLDDAEKSLLQLCAIAGKDFPLGVLQRVTRASPDALRARLGALCAADFLTAPSRANLDLYAFRHPLIQEVAYQAQLKQKRIRLHAEVAHATAALYGKSDEFAGLIAHHYEAAGHMLDAARALGRAAAWVGTTDTAQALRHWQKARELLLNQPAQPGLDAMRSRASIQIALLGWREGIAAEQVKPVIDEALNWTRQDDPGMVPMLLFLEGRNHISNGGSADEYVARVQRALGIMDEGDSTGRRAILNTALSQAYGWSGLLPQALQASDAALAQMDGTDAGEEFLGYRTNLWALNLRSRILVRMGLFSEASACMQTLLSIPSGDLDPTVRFIVHLGALELAAEQADMEKAREHAKEVQLIAAHHPSPYLRVFALGAQGLSSEVNGDYLGALDAHVAGLDLLRSTGAAKEYESELLANVAECQLALGKTSAARVAATETLDLSRQRGTRLPQCRATLVLAATEAEPDIKTKYLREADTLRLQTGAITRLALLSEKRKHVLNASHCEA